MADGPVLHSDGASEHAYPRSAGALRVANDLGGAWRLARVLGRAPAPLRDAVYDRVARRRHRLVHPDACPVPPPEAADRFIMDP